MSASISQWGLIVGLSTPQNCCTVVRDRQEITKTLIIIRHWIDAMGRCFGKTEVGQSQVLLHFTIESTSWRFVPDSNPCSQQGLHHRGIPEARECTWRRYKTRTRSSHAELLNESTRRVYYVRNCFRFGMNVHLGPTLPAALPAG